MRLPVMVFLGSFIFTYNVCSSSLPEGKAPDGYDNIEVREGQVEIEERRYEERHDEERERQAVARRQLWSQDKINRLAEAAERDSEDLSDSQEEDDVFFAAFNRARAQRLMGLRG